MGSKRFSWSFSSWRDGDDEALLALEDLGESMPDEVGEKSLGEFGRPLPATEWLFLSRKARGMVAWLTGSVTAGQWT